MNIGERIRKLREEKLLSQTELAKMVGITKQSLYKYESSIITNIPSSKIESIAQKLGTTPAYLMGWVDSTDSEKKNDTIADIILQIRSDEELLKIVKDICELSPEQQAAVQNLIFAFNNNK